MRNQRPRDYRVTVEPAGQAFVWIVTRSTGVVAKGEAPNRESASRLGQFAAAAMCSLERIGQRSF